MDMRHLSVAESALRLGHLIGRVARDNGLTYDALEIKS